MAQVQLFSNFVNLKDKNINICNTPRQGEGPRRRRRVPRRGEGPRQRRPGPGRGEEPRRWGGQLRAARACRGGRASALLPNGRLQPLPQPDRDRVPLYVLLGAVPLRRDVSVLKQLGVSGVVTLNESFETLVPSSYYKAHGIKHLEIPTMDYHDAPSMNNICRALDFIHGNSFYWTSL
ncbi:hypothetical protein BRADI_2g19338v3 [Brachypodium distachyon]|uniref:Uncharacterized protein n=1 Tax=Brachypodium distachyon TaxID=15368 RepID=A0A2K2D9D3_BRADI|nr:hypothetical protein BRADI_2g19338v3 [Brachypodium distachyon]PNT70873.1 hypothetical protein BRADI_2g19338v3 [Brachypodium distachyon]